MTNLQIFELIVAIGGPLIAMTVYAFIVFSRFLEKEKIRGEIFRAEHAAKPRPTNPADHKSPID